MPLNLAKELADLGRMTVRQLQQRYAEVCGEVARSRHKEYLVRRIAWRLQANAEGGLSERALRRAEELANLADVRVTAPKDRQPKIEFSKPTPTFDRRLPPVGSALSRQYKGRTITVLVLEDGFEHEGQRFGSLTAVAKAITGSHLNGYRFFGIEDRG